MLVFVLKRKTTKEYYQILVKLKISTFYYSILTPEEENPLKSKLEKELRESEWLNKFKQLSDGLRAIKIKLPLTQLCELKFITDSQSLVIHCPNQQVREELSQQRQLLWQLNMGAKRFILKYSDYQDIIIDAEGTK